MSRLRAGLWLCAVFVAAPALAASPDPKDLIVPQEDLSKARELVRRLGSEAYHEREEAHTALADMGRRARPALIEAAAGEADPEIRARALRLLPKAEAEELKARLDTFMADADGKFDHNLPGLKTFRKAVGSTAKARELYAEIIKSPYNADLFAAMERGPAEGGKVTSDRRTTIYSNMIQRNIGGGRTSPTQQPTLGDIAAVLVAETEIAHEYIPRTTVQWQPVSGVLLFGQSASQSALSGGPHTEPYRTIVTNWLRSRQDPQDLTQLMYQVNGGNLRQFPEAVPLTRRAVLHEGVQGYPKAQALAYLLQQRGKDELPFLRALVRGSVTVGDYPEAFKKGDDPKRVASTGSDGMVTQMWFQRNPAGGQAEMHTVTLRDVAFAHLLQQSGLSMRDFGFETPPNQNFTLTPGAIGQYAFTSEEKRQAGLVKFGWHQLKESLKTPDAPKP